MVLRRGLNNPRASRDGDRRAEQDDDLRVWNHEISAQNFDCYSSPPEGREGDDWFVDTGSPTPNGQIDSMK